MDFIAGAWAVTVPEIIMYMLILMVTYTIALSANGKYSLRCMIHWKKIFV
jgi:hypothetical protein